MIKFVVLVALVAIGSVGAVNFSNKKLNCDGFRLDPRGLNKDMNHVCSQIMRNNEKSIKIEPIKRFSMLHDCLCNLVPVQTIWASMVDEEVSQLYEQISKLVGGDLNEMEFWQKLEDSMQDEQTSLLERVFAPDSSEEAKKLAKDTCQALGEKFKPFYEILKHMVYFSGNPDLGFMLTQYDENMFKVMVVFKACA